MEDDEKNDNLIKNNNLIFEKQQKTVIRVRIPALAASPKNSFYPCLNGNENQLIMLSRKKLSKYQPK